MNIFIMLPVYDDWESALEVCKRIDAVLEDHASLNVSLMLIEDGSTSVVCPSEISWKPRFIARLSVLVLQRNLGHQRAIAIGLAHLSQHGKADALVIMDADGEDRPEDIPALLKAMLQGKRVVAVFAERGRRFEGFRFQLLYYCYRIVHRFVTGRDMRFGNFSALPWSYLDTLVAFPELWNHYAAAFLLTRLPYVRVRCNRAKRLRGKSRMNFAALVIHGLSALFANQELVGTRLLGTAMITTVALITAIVGVAGVTLFTSLAIPGWATTTIGLLLILSGQVLIAAFLLIFSIMMNRSHLGFLPIRDYSYFVRLETILYSR